MKAAFIVQRLNYYKYMGPLLHAAAGRGWVCQLWLLEDEGSKTYLAPSRENLPKDLAGLASLHFFDDRAGLQALADTAPDVVISLHTAGHHQIAVPEATRMITLQHGVDSFLESSPDDLAASDAFCAYGPFWLEWASRYYQAEGYGAAEVIQHRLEANSLIAGSPQLDVANDLDRDQIRAELGLDPDRKIVLLLPVNLTFWPGQWPWFFAAGSRLGQVRQLVKATRQEGFAFFRRFWRWALRGWNDAALVRAIRRFCDRNDALLIVKTRHKDPLRQTAAQLADLALEDQTYYPATILKLIAIADLCIHSYSSAVLEAARLNTFGLCIDRPNLDSHAHRLWRTHQDGEAFNFPGVNQWSSIPEMIERFDQRNLSDFRIAPQARDTFIRRYLTTDQAVSPGILDRIETMVDQAAPTLAEAKH